MAKRYKCPYCEMRGERKKLITHIDKKHEELIPEGYTSTRVVFDMVNHKDHGNCRICKKETGWNEKSGRYDSLCGNPKCKEAMREEYKKNMLRVKGTYNILNDPEQQQKMLANRSISGKYKHSDGAILTYTGSYEQKCLEFMDVVMNIPSKDIMSPGPTLEYIYKGEKHFYITDFLYIPYNLIIEVKDGGDNLNTKMTPGMIASRNKTIAKEKLITDKGLYNYIRLTNNEFSQLIEVFMDLKQHYIEGDNSKVIKINETSIDILSEAVNYINDKIIFDENYFNLKNERLDRAHLIAEFTDYKDSNILSKLVESFNNAKNIKYGDYGMCIIPNIEAHTANVYICNTKIFTESIKNGPKICPKCGGKVAVYIQEEPIFRCTNEDCKKFLGVVPFHNK